MVKVFSNNNHPDKFEKELNALLKITYQLRFFHKHIVKFIGTMKLHFREAWRDCLVFEKMSQGSLFDVQTSRQPLYFYKDVLHILLQVALGMRYIHSLHVVHGDLKHRNVLVDTSWRCVVADFGESNNGTCALQTCNF